MKELPIDVLLFNIFPGLPVKSLIKFTSVCKLWKSVLTTPEFARLHLNRVTALDSDESHKLLLLPHAASYYQGKSFEKLALESWLKTSVSNFPTKDYMGILMLASLDGLVCLAVKERSLDEFFHALVLWNPSTGSYRRVSNFGSCGYYYRHCDAFGLCYDSSNDDYKLLHVRSDNGQANMYSLKSDSWRKLEDSWRKVETEGSLRCFSCFWWSPGCFANGTLYFMANQYVGKKFLISFDLKTEKFKELPSPPVGTGYSHSQNFMVVRGCVHICCFYRNEVTTEIDIWRMEGKESVVWVKTATASIPCKATMLVQPLYVMKNGNWLMHDEFEGSVFKLDLEKENHMSAGKLVLGNNNDQFQVMLYTETLISPSL